MSKTVIIPSNYRPFVANVNGVIYSYPPGSSQTVPDEVAALIDSINALKPKEASLPGSVGQVWTRTENGYDWMDVLPGPGRLNQVLGWSAGRVAWLDDLPECSLNRCGGVFKAEAVADAEGDFPTAAEFNALLKALRDASVLALS